MTSLGMMGGSLYALDNGNDQIRRYTAAGFTATTASNSTTSLGAGTWTDMMLGNGYVVVNNSGNFRAVTIGGGNLSMTFYNVGATAISTYQDFAFAHSGTCYVSGLTAGGQRIINRATHSSNLGSVVMRNTYVLPSSGSFADIQVFTAPEPGSFAFLGLGLVALLARRRR